MKRKQYNGTYFGDKDIGKVRTTNEDEVRIGVNSKANVLMVLADGISALRKGDLASTTAVNHLVDRFCEKNGFLAGYFAKKWLCSEVKVLNRRLYNYQFGNKEHLQAQTTLSVSLLYKDTLYLLNIGDSRIYLFGDDKKLIQIFDDQTYANYLQKKGKLDKDTASIHPSRHILMNVLGEKKDISYDFTELPYNGEKILLCSDGLYDLVKLSEIETILGSRDSTEEKVRSLISLANFNGGSDNISVCLWEPIND